MVASPLRRSSNYKQRYVGEGTHVRVTSECGRPGFNSSGTISLAVSVIFVVLFEVLPYILSVERWIPLHEQCAEPHGVGALLVSLPAIQTTITREEIREREEREERQKEKKWKNGKKEKEENDVKMRRKKKGKDKSEGTKATGRQKENNSKQKEIVWLNQPKKIR